jgi:hypothetical protein
VPPDNPEAVRDRFPNPVRSDHVAAAAPAAAEIEALVPDFAEAGDVFADEAEK